MTTENTQPTAPAAAPAEPAVTSDGADNLDQRAEALIESLKSDAKAAASPATTEGGATEETPEEAPEKPAPAPAAASTKTPEQIQEARAARLAAIEEMAAREREHVAAARAAKPPPAAPAPEPAKGPVVTDEQTFFAAAEQLGLTPQKLADWLAKQNDPALAAAEHTRKALTPLEQKVAELEAHQKALLDSITARERAAKEAEAAAANTRVLLDHLASVADEAPLTSRLSAKSPQKFMQIVNAVCDDMPDGFTAQDVIDRIEVELSDFQLHEVATDSTPKRTKEPAAAKANVGNRLAAERGTTVDPDDDVPADLDSRAARLKARLAAAG